MGTKSAQGIAAQGGVGGDERGAMRLAVELAEALKRPQRVDGRVAAGLQFRFKCGHGVGALLFDEQSLGGKTPEKVVVA